MSSTLSFTTSWTLLSDGVEAGIPASEQIYMIGPVFIHLDNQCKPWQSSFTVLTTLKIQSLRLTCMEEDTHYFRPFITSHHFSS